MVVLGTMGIFKCYKSEVTTFAGGLSSSRASRFSAGFCPRCSYRKGSVSYCRIDSAAIKGSESLNAASSSGSS